MLTDQHLERLARAKIALEGLAVGDCAGGIFEFSDFQTHSHFLKNRRLPNMMLRFTDDTNMALSIYSVLRQEGLIQQDKLAHNFGLHFESGRGYGMGAHHLLKRVRAGESWRDLSAKMFKGGSYGNGGAMRVAPLGAYFADDLTLVVEQARLSAEITHAHPEGIAGAVAVAVGTAIAWQAKQAQERPNRSEFIARILPYVPLSEVATGIEKAGQLPDDLSFREVVKILGNGSEISAQDTVPFVLWSAGTQLDNYEEAIWQTISAGGDVDTTCAMVGGIVATYLDGEGIPAEWRANAEPLPAWAFEENT